MTVYLLISIYWHILITVISHLSRLPYSSCYLNLGELRDMVNGNVRRYIPINMHILPLKNERRITNRTNNIPSTEGFEVFQSGPYEYI